jgi:hypothetical protein
MQQQIIKLLLCLPLCTAHPCNAKLLIITHNFNQPSFIELQYKSFKKFLVNDFEYVVFNDAIDPQLAEQICSTCKRFGIDCYRIPQENRTARQVKINLKNGNFWAAARHGQAIRYSMEVLGFKHHGPVMMIDSDMFLIKSFNAQDFMQNNHIAGLRQVRNGKINYLWGGLIFFRMDKLPHKESMNFSNGLIDGTYVDSCGYLHYYFKENPDIKILYFEQDFRHFLDTHLRSYGIATHYNGNNFKSWPKYMRCAQCTQTNTSCKHTAEILKELNFGEQIINFVTAQKMPPTIEFVLKDTFLHYQDGTNYSNASAEFIETKKSLLLNFMGTILDDASITGANTL